MFSKRKVKNPHAPTLYTLNLPFPTDVLGEMRAYRAASSIRGPGMAQPEPFSSVNLSVTNPPSDLDNSPQSLKTPSPPPPTHLTSQHIINNQPLDRFKGLVKVVMLLNRVQSRGKQMKKMVDKVVEKTVKVMDWMDQPVSLQAFQKKSGNRKEIEISSDCSDEDFDYYDETLLNRWAGEEEWHDVEQADEQNHGPEPSTRRPEAPPAEYKYSMSGGAGPPGTHIPPHTNKHGEVQETVEEKKVSADTKKKQNRVSVISPLNALIDQTMAMFRDLGHDGQVENARSDSEWVSRQKQLPPSLRVGRPTALNVEQISIAEMPRRKPVANAPQTKRIAEIPRRKPVAEVPQGKPTAQVSTRKPDAEVPRRKPVATEILQRQLVAEVPARKPLPDHKVPTLKLRRQQGSRDLSHA
jgi:hypothetical protein